MYTIYEIKNNSLHNSTKQKIQSEQIQTLPRLEMTKTTKKELSISAAHLSYYLY